MAYTNFCFWFVSSRSTKQQTFSGLGIVLQCLPFNQVGQFFIIQLSQPVFFNLSNIFLLLNIMSINLFLGLLILPLLCFVTSYHIGLQCSNRKYQTRHHSLLRCAYKLKITKNVKKWSPAEFGQVIILQFVNSCSLFLPSRRA